MAKIIKKAFRFDTIIMGEKYTVYYNLDLDASGNLGTDPEIIRIEPAENTNILPIAALPGKFMSLVNDHTVNNVAFVKLNFVPTIADASSVTCLQPTKPTNKS